MRVKRRSVAIEAVGKIHDERLRLQVGINATGYAGVVVAEKLTNQSMLAKLARNAKWWCAREAAVRKLDDPTCLAAIAKEDEAGAVSEAAMKRLAEIEKESARAAEPTPKALKKEQAPQIAKKRKATRADIARRLRSVIETHLDGAPAVIARGVAEGIQTGRDPKGGVSTRESEIEALAALERMLETQGRSEDGLKLVEIIIMLKGT